MAIDAGARRSFGPAEATAAAPTLCGASVSGKPCPPSAVLDLSGRGIAAISSFGPIIGTSAAPLRKLKLCDNALSRLTGLHEVAAGITFLDVSSNKLTPAALTDIAGMASLTVLNAAHCGLRDLPASALRAQVECLQALILNDNKLSDRDLAPLLALRKLNTLILSHNPRITSLPEGIARLSSLRKLSLAHCRLETLPPLPSSLAELRINDNALRGLPDSLSTCTALRLLDAGNNKIEHAAALLPLRSLPLLSNLNLRGNPVAPAAPARDAERDAAGTAAGSPAPSAAGVDVESYRRAIGMLCPRLAVLDNAKLPKAEGKAGKGQAKGKAVKGAAADAVEDEEEAGEAGGASSRSGKPQRGAAASARRAHDDDEDNAEEGSDDDDDDDDDVGDDDDDDDDDDEGAAEAAAMRARARGYSRPRPRDGDDSTSKGAAARGGAGAAGGGRGADRGGKGKERFGSKAHDGGDRPRDGARPFASAPSIATAASGKALREPAGGRAAPAGKLSRDGPADRMTGGKRRRGEDGESHRDARHVDDADERTSSRKPHPGAKPESRAAAASAAGRPGAASTDAGSSKGRVALPASEGKHATASREPQSSRSTGPAAKRARPADRQYGEADAPAEPIVEIVRPRPAAPTAAAPSAAAAIPAAAFAKAAAGGKGDAKSGAPASGAASKATGASKAAGKVPAAKAAAAGSKASASMPAPIATPAASAGPDLAAVLRADAVDAVGGWD